MLPTFLGIGPPKAASTWLYQLLASHPDVAMSREKELCFFSRHYSRGLGWYEAFFPEDEEERMYRAVGEVTPEYLYAGEEAVRRMGAMPSIQKLILIARHPIERAVSAHAHRVRSDNFAGGFEDFIEEFPHEVACGDYGRHVATYLRHFKRDQLLVLVFERLFKDVEATKRTLARFLGLDAQRFPPEAGYAVVNPGYVPRFQNVFALARSLLHWLKGGRVLPWLRRLGLVKGAGCLLGRQSKEKALPSMRPATRRRLARRYAGEVKRLEALTGLDLAEWKKTLP